MLEITEVVKKQVEVQFPFYRHVWEHYSDREATFGCMRVEEDGWVTSVLLTNDRNAFGGWVPSWKARYIVSSYQERHWESLFTTQQEATREDFDKLLAAAKATLEGGVKCSNPECSAFPHRNWFCCEECGTRVPAAMRGAK